MEYQTTKPERILKLLLIIPRNCLNSRVEFNGKTEQDRKNLDKLTIYFFFNRILSVFRW